MSNTMRVKKWARLALSFFIVCVAVSLRRQVVCISLRSPPGVGTYRMHRKILVINSKYQESPARMFGVGKTKHVMNKISFVFMVTAFEVPMCAFSASTKKVCNRLL